MITIRPLSLKYWGLNRKIKFVYVAMYSLVMSLCSRDLIITSTNTITIHEYQLINSGLTYTALSF